MTGRDLINLGFPQGPAVGVALVLIKKARKTLDREAIERELKAVLADPVANAAHPQFAELARVLREENEKTVYVERPAPAPYQIWGEGLEAGAVDQMKNAARLPISVKGALMPDAHVGYGLPIGGVLATENAVIPYAVGVDIACRMRITIFEMPDKAFKKHDMLMKNALLEETRFGAGAQFERDNLSKHDVLDHPDWVATPLLRNLKDIAAAQLGSSGGGNHFVEWGTFELEKGDTTLGISEPGMYLALLSHSGSRAVGHQI